MSRKNRGGRSRIPRITAVEVFLYRVPGPGKAPEWLLLQRESGLWQPACGKIERGETNLQAARREAKEESGIEPGAVRPAHWVDTFVDPEKGNVYLLPVFLAEVPADAEANTGEEHVEHVWLPLEEAIARVPFHGYREALRACEAMRQRLEAMKAQGIPLPQEGESFDRHKARAAETQGGGKDDRGDKGGGGGGNRNRRRRRRRRGGRGRGKGSKKGQGQGGGGGGGEGGG